MTENIARRDEAIRVEGDNFAKIKMEIASNKDALEERKNFLHQEKLEGKRMDMENTLLER